MNVLITGATSGIGYALTLKLIKNGHMVYLCVHTEKEVQTAFEKIKDLEYQDRVSVIKLDITNKEDRLLLKDLDIDCLVNHAGVGIGGSLLNLKVSDIKKNFETNFFSTLEMIKLYIETRKGKKGKILITSSLAGILPISFLGSYCSSKAALTMMVTCLRRELKKTNLNVRIKLIEPGAYKTGFNQFMLESKNVLSYKLFIEDMESITDSQKELFSLVEKRNLSSIVNKMYKAIESDSDKLIYRAPLLQVIGAKIYMLLFK